MVSGRGQIRGRQRLHALLTPKAIIGSMFGLIVLALLLFLSDARKVWELIEHFPPLLLPLIVALFVGREVFRSLQWDLFLHAIGIKATRRQAFLTLTGGDAAQVLPGGLYFQDVLAMRTFGVSFSQTLGATLLILWLEVTVCCLTLAILGLPDALLLRPVMALCGIGSVLMLLLLRSGISEQLQKRLHRWEGYGRQRWPGRPGQLLSKLLGGMERVLGSLKRLARPKVLLLGLALGAVYITLTTFALYLICVGFGLSSTITPGATAAIYSLSLVVVVLNPLPTDLGIAEGSGVGGLLLFGVSAADGLAIMLIFRVLLMVTEEGVAALAFLFSRKEVRHLFRSTKNHNEQG